MNKVFLVVGMIALIAVSTIACKNEMKKDTHKHAELVYACPMQCEGDKTYANKETKCPVCKMKLVTKETEGSDDQDTKREHGSEGRDHDD
jgi:hypothetical protein